MSAAAKDGWVPEMDVKPFLVFVIGGVPAHELQPLGLSTVMFWSLARMRYTPKIQVWAHWLPQAEVPHVEPDNLDSLNGLVLRLDVDMVSRVFDGGARFCFGHQLGNLLADVENGRCVCSCSVFPLLTKSVACDWREITGVDAPVNQK